MDSGIMKKLISNMRDPLMASRHVKFTSRCVRFLCQLFDGAAIECLDMHNVILKMAFSTKGIEEEKHVSLPEAIVYLMEYTPTCISKTQVMDLLSELDINKDNEYNEVKVAIATLNEYSKKQ